MATLLPKGIPHLPLKAFTSPLSFFSSLFKGGGVGCAPMLPLDTRLDLFSLECMPSEVFFFGGGEGGVWISMEILPPIVLPWFPLVTKLEVYMEFVYISLCIPEDVKEAKIHTKHTKTL